MSVIVREDPPRTGPDQWVPRFGRTERFTHWWTVLMFAAALLTGVAMGGEAESGPLLDAHVGAVVLIGVGFVAALIFGDRRAVLRSMGRLFLFDRRDVDAVRARLRHPLAGGGEVRWGKFNVGQKLLAWSITASVGLLVVTGIASVGSGGDGGGAHGAAVLLAGVLLGAHVFMAVLNPATRPALPGMIGGRVRRSWAAQHHPDWLDRPR